MTEFVRVKDKETGHHLSIPRDRFDADSAPYEELKSAATFADGTPRPPKYKTTVTEAAGSKSGGQTSPKEKE